MISREEARRPMKRRMVLPAIVLVLAGLWVISVGLGAEDLAELYVTKIVLDPPSTISRGEVVEVYARVMNTGARSADGFNISFFYRHQSSAGTWILHKTEEDVSLPPSHQDFYPVVFQLDTAELELGTYELRIVADSSNHISETDELNNELRTTMTLMGSSLGLPDLQPVSLAYVHSNPGATDDMEPWNVTTQIRNLGEAQAGQFVVAFLVNGEEFARQIRFALPADGVTDISAELDPEDPDLPLAAGTHQIAVVIDPGNEVVEQDEGNNTLFGALTLQSVELVPLSLAFDKSVVRLDEETRVTAEIRNDGEGAAKSVLVHFYVGHVRFASDTIDILGRGMTAFVEGILDPEKQGLTDAPAVYEIRVAVDPDDLLQEFDEDNNEMSRTLTILPPEVKKPELHPESIKLTPPSPAEQGRADTVTVTSVIKNTGRADAEVFDVRFYYRVKGSLRWDFIACADDVSCGGLTLAAGAQATIVGTLKAKDLALMPGIYEVRVVVDSSASVDELDESNNELITTLTLLASRLPDLAFCPDVAIVREPLGDAQHGQTIRLAPCITNLGEQDAGPFTVRFSYCPLISTVTGTATSVQCSETYGQSHFDPGPEIDVPGLAIGESVSVPVMLETRDLLPRQYRILVEIDPDDDVQERNPYNNALNAQLTVLGPDLAVVGLTTSPQGIVDQAETDKVEVVATVINTGVVATGEFKVRIRLFRVSDQGLVAVRAHVCGESTPSTCESDEHFCVVTLSGIGVLVPEQIRWTLDLAQTDLDPGQYIVRVEADCEGDIDDDGVCDGKIAEHNELNNALELPLTVLPRPADLAIIGPINFPDGIPVEYGEVVPITVNIVNTGGLTAVGSCGTSPSCGIGVEFLIYEDGTQPDGGEQLIRITPIETIPSLEPGEEVEVTVLLETELLDPFVTAYQVHIRVDPTDSIQELDESNNHVTMALALQPLPADLAIAGPIAFPDGTPVKYGDVVRITAMVANIGGSTAEGACGTSPSCGIGVEFLIYQYGAQADEGEQIVRIVPYETIRLLDPGDVVQVSAFLKTEILDPFMTGYRVCVRVDPGDSIEELDESNNELCTSPQLELYPPPPDLKVASAGSGEPVVRFDPPPPVEYADQPIRAQFSIVNDSRSPSTGFNVALRLRPSSVEGAEWIELDRLAVAGFAAGEERPFSYAIVLPPVEDGDERMRIPPGVYEFCIIVDVDDFVPETDEQNNTYCTPVGLIIVGEDDGGPHWPPCPDCADLKIRSVSARVVAGEIGEARVCATIENIGPGDAAAFTVRAYYVPEHGAEPLLIEDPWHRTQYDGLPAGETATFRQDFDVSGLEDGFYDVFVVVDVDNNVAESNEENNIKDEALWIH